MPSKSPNHAAAAELQQLTQVLLDPDQSQYSLFPEITALNQLLSEQATFQIDPTQDMCGGETRLDHGLAVSPMQAALCAYEMARTILFMRGLNQAISDAIRLRPGSPVRVLYAGCGPYALLAIAQMIHFSPAQVCFTLIDCHQPALDSAKSVIDGFMLNDFAVDYHLGDACRYQIPADQTPDVVVSETMNVALSNEPQVMITRHLRAQAPQAIFVPQSVRVDVCLLDSSQEFKLTSDQQKLPTPSRDRVPLGTVFVLDADSVDQWKAIDEDRLPGASVQIPATFESRYDPKLMTVIRVYKDLVLRDYDCSLTIPQPIPSSRTITGGELLEFYYQLGAIPNLHCVVQA